MQQTVTVKTYLYNVSLTAPEAAGGDVDDRGRAEREIIGSEHTTTFNTGLYNQCQKDQVRYANAAFAAIGLGGQTGTWAISQQLSNLNLNGQELDSGSTGNASGLEDADIVTYFGGNLCTDHYMSDTYRFADNYWGKYSSDLHKIHAAFSSCKLMIGEWGYHPVTDPGDVERAGVYQRVVDVYRSKSYIIGVNSWNHMGQTQSLIFTDNSGTLRFSGLSTPREVQRAFTTGNAEYGPRVRG
jgi:hypothetical protein